MRVNSYLATLGALLLPITSATPTGVKRSGNEALGPDENGFYWISTDAIKAAFIPYGAAITKLLIKDQYGIERDIIVGWDNATAYENPDIHPHFGSVPGRYANRIKNSTFEIDGETFKVDANENDGKDTLHGGSNGWDYRNFTVVAHTEDSITFSIVDPDGEQGFPGEVISYVTYTVHDSTWDLKMVAIATTEETPIMLSSHAYWNLDGFGNNETNNALNHTLYLPYSGQRVGVDNILIPTGDILANEKGSVNDFWSAPKQLGADLDKPEAEGNCGFNCTGYDNCWLVSREHPFDWRTSGPVATLHSAWSGIQIDVYTDQEAFQVYGCNSQDGSWPIKSEHQGSGNPGFAPVVEKYGCVVLEVEDWIDGINHPEWGRQSKQIFSPGGDPYVLQASYVFSVNSTSLPGGSS